MLEFLIYDLKVACLIAIFYMFYRLMLANETMHHLNRIVLLSTAVLSFVLPLCVFTIHRTVTVAPMTGIQVGMPEVAVLSEEEETLWWLTPISVLFVAGAILTLGHSLLSIIKVATLISKSEKHPQTDGTTIVVVDEAIAPFSWMRYIVLSREDYDSPDAAILAHERGHIRQHHSWDVLLTNIVTTLQWFNPAVWMLRSDLRSIHEFEADKEVLSQGINARQYQLLLVTKALATVRYSVANSISHSTLKKRINMMLKKKSNAMHGLKVLFALPIIMVALVINAKTETKYVYSESPGAMSGLASIEDDSSLSPTPLSDTFADIIDDTYIYIVDGKQMTDISGIPSSDIASMTALKGESAKQLGYNRNVVIVKLKKKGAEASVTSDEAKGVFTPSPNNDDKVMEVCEEMPVFPGGMSELLNYLSKNLKYPKAALDANKQGRVLVSFVINKTGEVSDATIFKGVDESLDKEALRVVSMMPNWTPGKHDGHPVRVKYNLPISFRLPASEDTFTGEVTYQAGNSHPISGKYTNQTEKDNTSAGQGQDGEAIKINPSGEVKIISRVLVDGKEAPLPRLFIDDVEKSMDELKTLSTSSIDHINVDKTDGKQIIRIYTKK